MKDFIEKFMLEENLSVLFWLDSTKLNNLPKENLDSKDLKTLIEEQKYQNLIKNSYLKST
jgi:hypothetical protein